MVEQPMRVPNDALRALIKEADLSYAALARRVRQVADECGQSHLSTSAGSVANWVKGTPPKDETATFVAEALSRRLGRLVSLSDIGLPSQEDASAITSLAKDPVASLAHLGRIDVDRRTFLNASVYSAGAVALPLNASPVEAAGRSARAVAGGIVGEEEVAVVKQVTEVFTKADERLGGNTGRTAVVEYLTTDVTAYCRSNFANYTVRRDMFGAAAELAYLVGWKSHDAGMSGLAQRYYLHAFQLATESDPSAHAGYVLRILAHQAFDNGHHAHCVDLAEAALRRARGNVDKETEALFWLTLARAHAAEGTKGSALSAILRAEQLMSVAHDDLPPSWASLGGPAEARLANQTAKALIEMQDLAGAEQQYRRASQCWNPVTHRRIHALTLADLGETQLKRGHAEAACATWGTALDGLKGVRSARARGAVSDMRQNLSSFRHRGSPEARALEVRAAELQAAHT
jgi:tetratricopeptide (TPR) repeat protein